MTRHDSLIFTAGIGENSSLIRQKICDNLTVFGVQTCEDKNKQNATTINADGSKVGVHIIPTNEELVIAQDVKRLGV